MDILKFINSNSVRRYLQEIKYEFSPIEAAFIIWQSDFCSMQEKHEAWRWLIENTTDENVIFTISPAYRHSKELGDFLGLHKYLREYMRIEDRLVETAMKTEEKAVFSFAMYYRGDRNICEDKRLFSSYEQLVKAIDAEIEKMSDYELEWIFVKKQQIDADGKYTELQLAPDKTIYGLSYDRKLSDYDLEIAELFSCMWFKIPVPFQKGDIVYENRHNIYTDNGKDMPFVLEKICYWGIDDIEEAKNKHAWCDMDMTAYGYFQKENGEIYYECEHNYLALEYYPEELEGERRILKALSNYLKGKISIDLLMNSYHIILNEEEVNAQKSICGKPMKDCSLWD